MKIAGIREHPEYLEMAADYFSSKWKVARQIYHDSMTDSIRTEKQLPRWYLLMEGDGIVGCHGLIENDFMVRTDLFPWLCALYVEPDRRGEALGALLIENACREAKALGFKTIYLCTDHIGYYEKYGWHYFGDEESQFGSKARVYQMYTGSHV